MRSCFFVIGLLLTANLVYAGKIYQWKDAEGRVIYSDQPPPATAKEAQEKKLSGNVIDYSEMPYALQQAVKKYPVTLYTYNCGEGCSRARSLLRSRGIPYTEKDPQNPTEAEELRKLTGTLDVPTVAIGNKVLRGYEPAEWNLALDAAGYPKGANKNSDSDKSPSKPTNPSPNGNKTPATKPNY